MDINEAIRTELHAILTSKVFPILAPDTVIAPYITYQPINTDRIRTLMQFDSLVDAPYQIDIFHTTFANLIALKTQIIAEIKTWMLSTLATTGPYCQAIDITEEIETYDPETKLYQCTIDFTISFKEV